MSKHSREIVAGTMLLLMAVSIHLPAQAADRSEPAVKPAYANLPNLSIVLESGSQDRVARFAVQALRDDLQYVAGPNAVVRVEQGKGKGSIRLAIDPARVRETSPQAGAEAFRIKSGPDGLLICGTDGRGVLWGVRDFIHYYSDAWLRGLSEGKSEPIDVVSKPAIDVRGFWSWWHGCYDPFAYVDRASEWKLNTVTFWNRGVPLDAERLANYSLDRGVDIWWGFSWGWVAEDFKDASPPLAKKLMALYESQKKKIGPGLVNLCPQEPETPQALKEYVLDVFEHQYAWVPGIKGVYFQTATEAVCPCPRCKAAPRGEGFMKTILPIIEELHRRYPNLLISCGVHNTGDINTFKALKGIPDYAQICWEAGVTWAPSMDVFKDQLTYRGAQERIAGVYRITMNCGMVFRAEDVRAESARNWLPRMDRLWDYLEEGQPEGSGSGFKSFKLDGKEIGYPCSSDWRPKTGRAIDNPNFKTLLDWSRVMAQSGTCSKGIFPLVEAGLIDLKMRRVPAMVAEAIWDPLRDENELERRANLIWNRQVGGWREPINPAWNASPEVEVASADTATGEATDNGQIYHNMAGEKSDAPSAQGIALVNGSGRKQPIEFSEPWKISENKTLASPGGTSFAIAGPATSDLELSLKMMIPEGRVGGVIFHYKDPANYDMVNIYSDMNQVFWYRCEGGQTSEIARGEHGGVKNGEWFKLMLTTRKNETAVKINDKEILRASGDAKDEAGKFGLRSETNQVLYRDISAKTGSGGTAETWRLAAQ